MTMTKTGKAAPMATTIFFCFCSLGSACCWWSPARALSAAIARRLIGGPPVDSFAGHRRLQCRFRATSFWRSCRSRLLRCRCTLLHAGAPRGTPATPCNHRHHRGCRHNHVHTNCEGDSHRRLRAQAATTATAIATAAANTHLGTAAVKRSHTCTYHFTHRFTTCRLFVLVPCRAMCSALRDMANSPLPRHVILSQAASSDRNQSHLNANQDPTAAAQAQGPAPGV